MLKEYWTQAWPISVPAIETVHTYSQRLAEVAIVGPFWSKIVTDSVEEAIVV